MRDILKENDLSIGDRVRFRHRPEQNWTQGEVIGQAKDLSVNIVDDGGHIRSLMPDRCQKQVKGPRGGTTWIDIVKDGNEQAREL